MSESLRVPAGMSIPAELETSWRWMEKQGWGANGPQGYVLPPYAGAQQSAQQRGVVFGGVSLEGWFPSDSEAHSKLVPVAELAGDGTIGALWLTEAGQTKVVSLGSEGSCCVVAESAVDFLRLCAVGYDELTTHRMSAVPEAELVEALGPFRTWVEATLGEPVPAEWPPFDTADEFSRWVATQLGEEPEPAPEVPAGLPADAVTGDVATILSLLGDQDGARRLGELVGTTDASRLRRKRDGLEIAVRQGGLATVWLQVARYWQPDRLFGDLIDLDWGRDQVVGVLGEPERHGSVEGEAWCRYVIGGRYVRLGFRDGAFTDLTFMTDAPG